MLSSFRAVMKAVFLAMRRVFSASLSAAKRRASTVGSIAADLLDESAAFFNCAYISFSVSFCVITGSVVVVDGGWYSHNSVDAGIFCGT